jgi:hypothetical protein
MCKKTLHKVENVLFFGCKYIIKGLKVDKTKVEIKDSS